MFETQSHNLKLPAGSSDELNFSWKVKIVKAIVKPHG